MSLKTQSFFSFLTIVSLALFSFLRAVSALEPGAAEQADKTLSPYFFVKSESPDTDTLPLKSTRADVVISGVISQVKVTQVYKNEGKNTLEAIYVFPTSSRAAVYNMKMTVGERIIQAKINEREKARQDYEAAIKAGKTASLLEQQRPNVFQMNVGNILPNDTIKVELYYTEMLVPENGIYEFVYPTVVGPRYSNLKEEGSKDTENWVKNPYLHSGEDATFTFGLDLTLNSGMPISQVSSPSHDVKVSYQNPQTAQINIPEAKDTGNRDFILKYSLAGNQIESGTLLYSGGDENFFLTMIEPPKQVSVKQIVPREYIFIVDVSGSMYGFPLDTSKALIRDLISKLRPTDFFNVLLFSGGNSVLSETSLPATSDNIQKAIDTIEHQQGGGGTELMPALKRALALPRAEGTSRSVIIATDGYVSVEKEAFEYVRANLGKANMFAFGIGNSVNRFLMEGLARAGMGEPFVVLNPQKAPEEAAKLRAYIDSPVLTGIKVKFNNFDAYDVEPESIPDLFAKKPVIIFGKYKGSAAGSIQISGSAAGESYKDNFDLKTAVASEKNEALRYLWARQKIMLLADMNKLAPDDARVKQVTDLGLKYSLMTDYTSFVAIDMVVRSDGKTVQVKQPLPMPKGVSDYAVGEADQMQAYSGSVNRALSMPMVSKTMLRADGGAVFENKLGNERLQNAEEIAKGKSDRRGVFLSIESVEGALNLDEAEQVINKSDGDLKALFVKALGQKPSLAGQLKVEISIGAGGEVREVKVVEDKLKDADFIKSVSEVLKKLSFSKPKDGKEATVKCLISFG